MISGFKSRVALVLAFLFLLQTFSIVFIYADFVINNDYIATVLCVNKSKPEMHCDGKCYLKMELQKEEKKNQAPANTSKENNKIQFFSETQKGYNLAVISTLENKPSFNYFQFFSEAHPFGVFHPPQV